MRYGTITTYILHKPHSPSDRVGNQVDVLHVAVLDWDCCGDDRDHIARRGSVRPYERLGGARRAGLVRHDAVLNIERPVDVVFFLVLRRGAIDFFMGGYECAEHCRLTTIELITNEIVQ